MASGRWLIKALELFVILVAVALIAGQVLGQPVLLGFVETGSMAPTMNSGDGFIAIPAAVAGSIEEGDVVVFQAEEIQGGGLTTHRVVDATERGYITKGDNNPFTDQDDDEPPVKRAQIVAKAAEFNDRVIVIPHLGTSVERINSVLKTVQYHLAGLFGIRALLGVQGLAYLLFAGSLVWYAVGEWRRDERDRKYEQRDDARDSGSDARLIVGMFTLLLVFGATVAMVGPTGNQKLGVVSAEFDSPRPNVVPAGGSADQTLTVRNGGVLPAVVFIESASEGATVQPNELRIQPRGAAEVTVTLQAPTDLGYYRHFVTQHYYLAVLPQPSIRAFYRVHPWAPIVVIDALIGIPFYLLGVRLVGTGRVKRRSRSRDLHLLTRCRRMLRQLY